jgi:hypothetical protein
MNFEWFVFVCIVLSGVSLVAIYLIIKAAVRNGVLEAHEIINTSKDGQETDDRDRISQKTCPQCGRRHDMDYPKCPHCRHQY